LKQEIDIFEMDRSVEDDRPVIEFDAKPNQGIDWQKLDTILRGQHPVADYDEVQVSISNPDASSWGFYSVPGTLGLISAKAVEWIGYPAFHLYELLPAKLNGTRYFFMKCNEVLPCLDRDNSEIITFRSDPQRVKEIKKHKFHKNIIYDPLIFSIPESFSRIYVTSTVYDAIVQSRIPGFRFSHLQ
jgi:hypothetical protein